MSRTHASGISRLVNHGIVGATFVFSIFACGVLAVFSSFKPVDAGIGIMIYGLSLLACSFCSYMYTIRSDVRGSRAWRHLDHAAIFLLIAGTYTPFALNIAGPFGIKLIYTIWALAITGVVLRLLIRQGYERLFVGLYVLIGWLFITAITDVVTILDRVPLILLGAGAAAYTIGAGLFARDIGKWTDPVWHAFVFVGAYFHFLAVLDTAASL